jgi:hypothetical protein
MTTVISLVSGIFGRGQSHLPKNSIQKSPPVYRSPQRRAAHFIKQAKLHNELSDWVPILKSQFWREPFRNGQKLTKSLTFNIGAPSRDSLRGNLQYYMPLLQVPSWSI